MSVSLGGVTLDNRMLLQGLFDSPQIATNQRVTLGGVRKISFAPLGGRVLVLTTSGPNGVNFGFFTRAQLEAIAVLRDTGIAVSFVHHAATYTVFLEAGCLSVSPVTETTLKSADDWYSGSITMIEV